MSKEDCLLDLPSQARVRRWVSSSAEFEVEHTKALKNAIATARQSNCEEDITALGLIQKLRRVKALAKVDGTVVIAARILQQEPVVIFTSCVEAAELVHSKLERLFPDEGVLFTGKTLVANRSSLVAEFQSGEKRFFVATYGAGGVGLTLIAASKVILLDRTWTPGEVLQAENRVHRIGQEMHVTSIWVTAFELDRQIDSMLEFKHETTMRVLTGCSTRVAENVSIIAWLKSRRSETSYSYSENL
jgi:SNF2 family DNA or RNA helicase